MTTRLQDKPQRFSGDHIRVTENPNYLPPPPSAPVPLQGPPTGGTTDPRLSPEEVAAVLDTALRYVNVPEKRLVPAPNDYEVREDLAAAVEKICSHADAPTRMRHILFELAQYNTNHLVTLARALRNKPAAYTLWEVLEPGKPFPPEPGFQQALAGSALLAASVRKPSIFEYAKARATRKSGILTVGGAQIQRLAPNPQGWTNTFYEKAFIEPYKAYDHGKLAGAQAWALGLATLHTEGALKTAVSRPLIKDPQGQPKKFGDVAIVVPGLLNLASTPAALARVAQHVKGPVILASANVNGPDGLRLRTLTTYLGLDLTKPIVYQDEHGQEQTLDLNGKLWIIGEEDPFIMSWQQHSDVLLQQLEVIRREFPALQKANPDLKNIPDYTSARTTVLGFSQAALAD